MSDALFGSPPHVAFNFDDETFGELFGNHEFRKAMEFAVNRERVIEDVYNGLATIPGTPTAPADGTFYEDTTGLMNDYDLEAAAAALDDLGVVDSDGDGIRNMPDGGPNLQFGLTYASDSQTFTDIATIVQNDFRQIGVQADLVAVQNSALLSTGLAGDYQAIILASSGLKRLGFDDRIRYTLPDTLCLPAVGQGALGIECRLNDQELIDLLAPLNHQDSWDRVRAERALNRRLEGGCQVPIACYAIHQGDQLWLRGLVAEPDGSRVLSGEICGPASTGERMGVELAERLFEGEFLAHGEVVLCVVTLCVTARGSRTSRSASPKKFNPSTLSMIANPGTMARCGVSKK